MPDKRLRSALALMALVWALGIAFSIARPAQALDSPVVPLQAATNTPAITPSSTTTHLPSHTPIPSLTATATTTLTPSSTWTPTYATPSCLTRPLQRLSLANGTSPNEASYSEDLSGDGRFVVFSSSADNLIASDANAASDVFRIDLETCALTLVSISETGLTGNSYGGSISDDGRFVAFLSRARLVNADLDDETDVYIRDMQSQNYTYINLTLLSPSIFIGKADLSANGRYLVYPFHDAGQEGLRWTDLQTGDQAQVSTDGFQSTLSADGQTVTFISRLRGTNLWQVNLWRRNAGAVNIGNQYVDPYQPISLSGDGRLMAYSSEGRIVVYDSLTSQLTSVTGTANDPSASPSLSRDGRIISYSSDASNLVANDTNRMSDIFVTNRQTGQTVLLSQQGSTPGDRSSIRPQISADGRFVVYHSSATNLIADDTNREYDVFMAQVSAFGLDLTLLNPTAIPIPSNTPSPTATLRPGECEAASTEVRFVGFESSGVVRLEIRNPHPFIAYLTSFDIRWREVGNIYLRRIVAVAPPGSPGSLTIWDSGVVGEDNNSPTIPSEGGGLRRALVIPAGSPGNPTVIPLLLDFDGTDGPLSDVGISSSDFNGTFFDIGCDPPLGPGLYEENVSALRYSGSWLPYQSGRPDSTSTTYTNDPAASVKFPIDSTHVAALVIWRSLFNAAGEMDVYVNGVKKATIPSQAEVLTWYTPYALPLNLPAGIHMIEIRNTSDRYIMIEAIQLLRLATIPVDNSREENDVSLTYVGNWLDYSQSTPGPLGGSIRYTQQPDAALLFNLSNARGVTVWRTLFAGVGSTEICLYSALAAPLCQTFAPPTQILTWAQPMTLRAEIPGGYTVRIRNLGAGYTSIERIDTVGNYGVFSASNAIIEENNANIAYMREWIDYVAPQPIGGNARYSNVRDARFSVRVDNSVGRVRVFRTLLDGAGEVAVYIDSFSTPHVIIPSQATTTQWAKPFTFDIPPGSRDLTFRLVTSNQYFVLEGLQFLPPQPVLGVGSYEENNPAFVTEGNWISYNAADPLGGNAIYSNDANASLSFKVNNTVGRIVVYHTLSTGFGRYSVTVNGVTTTIDSAANALKWGEPAVIEIASPGNHTVTLRNLFPSYVVIERIDLLPPLPELGVGLYQENNLGLAYSSNWLSYLDPASAGGSSRYINQSGATIRFRASAAVNQIVLTWAVGNSFGNLEVRVNGVLVDTISSASTSFAWGQTATITLPANATADLVELRTNSTGYVIIEQIELRPHSATPVPTNTPGQTNTPGPTTTPLPPTRPGGGDIGCTDNC